ncbi:MAG: hypothetical protein WCL13_03795 [bacterium]
MEKIFKTLFVLGVIVFCIVIVVIFLLLLKLILMFNQQINLFGMVIQ